MPAKGRFVYPAAGSYISNKPVGYKLDFPCPNSPRFFHIAADPLPVRLDVHYAHLLGRAKLDASI